MFYDGLSAEILPYFVSKNIPNQSSPIPLDIKILPYFVSKNIPNCWTG